MLFLGVFLYLISFPGQTVNFRLSMSHIFGKLWHSAIIWSISKSFQCILQGVRFLLANHTLLSGTSENELYTGVTKEPSVKLISINIQPIAKIAITGKNGRTLLQV